MKEKELINKFSIEFLEYGIGNVWAKKSAKKQMLTAEDFAIEFGEWLRINCYDSGDNWLYLEDNQDYTTVELLKIFKEEKL